MVILNMKNRIYFIVLSFALLFINGCSKDVDETIIEPDTQSLAIFHAKFENDPVTRVALGTKDSNGNIPLKWEKNDAVAIVGRTGDYSIANDYSPIRSIVSLSNSGSTIPVPINDSISGVYAMYPYQDTVNVPSYSGMLDNRYAGEDEDFEVVWSVFPSVQYAVENGVGKDYLPMLAYSTYHDATFDFYSLNGLLAFSLSDENIASIELKGNRNEVVSGSYHVFLAHTKGSEPQLPSDYYGHEDSVEKGESIILLPPKGTSKFKTGITYYFSLLPQDFIKGINIVAYTNDGGFFQIKSSSELNLERSLCINLGTLTGQIQKARDFTIGKTKDLKGVNFTFYGTLPSGSAITKPGKYLLEAGGEYKIDNDISLTDNLVLVGENSDNRPTVDFYSHHVIPNDASSNYGVYFKNINITSTPVGVVSNPYMLGIVHVKKDIKNLYVDNCKAIYNKLMGTLLAGYSEGCISEVRIINNIFNPNIKGDMQEIISAYSKKCLIQNNVIFNKDIMSYYTHDFSKGPSELNVSNNLYYNVNTSMKNDSSSYGYLRIFTTTNLDLTYKNNIIVCLSDDLLVNRFIHLCWGAQPTINKHYSNNYSFGIDWDDTGKEAITPLNQNPIASFDTETGKFKMKDKYKDCGPQL